MVKYQSERLTLFNSKSSDALAHPVCQVELLNELPLDVGYDAIAKIFSVFRECFFHKEFAKNPS